MDYISSIFLILGLILTGKKNKWGWILSILGSLGYLYLLFDTKFYGMIILNVIMAGLGIYNFIKWNKK